MYSCTKFSSSLSNKYTAYPVSIPRAVENSIEPLLLQHAVLLQLAEDGSLLLLS